MLLHIRPYVPISVLKKSMKMASATLAKEINPNSYDDVEKLTQFIRSKIRQQPTIGLICGSGLGKIADLLINSESLPYKDIPNFPVSSVAGHSGRFVVGALEGKTIICMQGRSHPYEGYDFAKAAMPVRVMKLLGIKILIVTNAAGGLNSSYKSGDMVVLKDHLFTPGLGGNSPLRGPNDERFGPRFVPMLNAYDYRLRKLALETGKEIGCTLHEGVYAMAGGPQYETPAENRFLKLAGCDVVGMSTAHEVVVARHCDLNVLGISMVTNMSEMSSDIDDADKPNTNLHAEVLEVGNRFSDAACKLVSAIIKKLPN